MAIRVDAPTLPTLPRSIELSASLRILCVLWILCIQMTCAYSDTPTIQSALFNDCDEAQHAFAKLPRDEQRSSVDYLVRVVALNTQAPSAPEAFAVMPGSKGFEHGQPALWQVTDAKRELRGKRCALKLLTEAGALAFEALPQLATLYSEQPLSDEITVGIEEAAASIAEAAHKEGLSLTSETIDRLLPLLLTERSLVTQNLMHEYITVSLPLILRYLEHLTISDGQKLVPFLADVNQNGPAAMRAFIEISPSLNLDASSRVASYLPFPDKQSLLSFIPDFARFAADPNSQPNLSALLGRACLNLNGVILDSSAISGLARNPKLLQPGFMDEQQQRCLLRSNPALSSMLMGLLSSSNLDEQRYALSLMTTTVKAVDIERERALFIKVKELSNDPSKPIQLHAIRSIGLFAPLKSEANITLVNMIKNALKAKAIGPSASPSATVIDAAFESALLLNPTPKEISKYGNLALEALKKGIISSNVVDVAAQIDTLHPEVFKLLTPRTPDLANIFYKALETHTTASLSARVVPQLRKALSRSPSSQRGENLAVLELLKATTRSERVELANTIASADNCTAVVHRAEIITQLLSSDDVDQGLKQKLAKRIAACLCSYPPSQSQELVQNGAIYLFSAPENIQQILKTPSECQLEQAVLANLNSESIPTPIRSNLLSHLIEGGSRDVKQTLLSQLNSAHPLAQQALPSVRRLAKELKDDRALAYQAVLALARLQDTQFEWPQYVQDAITMPPSAPFHGVAMETLRALPPQVVLEQLIPALESADPDHIAGACRVGGALGTRAIPIVSKIWSLREEHSPTVRYAAILALLEINPLTPELQHGVKSLLVNRYYTLAKSRLIDWPQSVAIVDLDVASFGTLRTAHLKGLLSK